MTQAFSAFIFTFILLFSVSCSSSASLPPDNFSAFGLPEEEINSRIKITVPEPWNNLDGGDPLGVVIDNISNSEIAFDQDYNVRLYIPENGHWKVIGNLVNYPDGKITLLPSNGDGLKMGQVDIVPDFPSNKKPSVLRIFITGNIVNNGVVTDQSTGAYLDIHP